MPSRLAHMIAALLLVAACSSSSNTVTPPPPPPAPPPPPPPPPTQHLYVGQDDVPGSILVYTLPITSSSTPVATVRHDATIALAVNSTTLAATRLTDYTVGFYALPITSASTPYATLSLGLLGTPVFLPSGALYLGIGDTINVYTPPFTSASTPSSRFGTGLSGGRFALDPSGNVYETNGGSNTIGVITNGAVTTRLTSAAGIIFRGLAANATQLMACEESGGLSTHVYIYNLPLTANATPATIMNINVSDPADCALDSSGNLYIAGAGGVIEYSPPFTTTSTRAVTLTVQGSAGAIAIGP
jgi:hypothetical protein